MSPYEKPSSLRIEKKLLDRRSFLRGVFGGVAATFINPLMPHGNEAQAVSLESGSQWHDGVSAFVRDVFYGATEVRGWHTHGSNKSDQWIFPRDLNLLKTEAAYVPQEESKLFARKDIEVLGDAHSHPLASLKEASLGPFPSSETEKIRNGERHAPLVPPSLDDLVKHAYYQLQYLQSFPGSYRGYVFDPRGMWTIQLEDMDFARAAVNSVNIGREIKKEAKRRDLSTEQSKKLMEALSYNDTESLRAFGDTIVELCRQHVNSSPYLEHSPYFRAITRYTNLLIGRQGKSLDERYANDTEWVNKTISDVEKEARTLGFVLTFSTYGELGVDVQKALAARSH